MVVPKPERYQYQHRLQTTLADGQKSAWYRHCGSFVYIIYSKTIYLADMETRYEDIL
jgi:hypothetical protein